ncbi:MAG TPA: hypothetical protein PLY78_12205, partial [Methanospirillum sp.]|nr:hypothetical protein [Methanospirillum sp.]
IPHHITIQGGCSVLTKITTVAALWGKHSHTAIILDTHPAAHGLSRIQCKTGCINTCKPTEKTRNQSGNYK